VFVVNGTNRVFSVTSKGATPAVVEREMPRAKRILALAAHPQFARNGRVFVAWEGPASHGETDVQVVRYTWRSGRLADQAFVARVRSRLGGSGGVMAFGPDGKLYLALPTGSASTIYRFEEDGTTPAEHVPRTPVFATGPAQPAALAWNPRTRDLWCVGNGRDAAQVLVFAARDTDAFSHLPVTGQPPPGAASARDHQARRVTSLVFLDRPDKSSADLLAVVQDGPGEVVRLSVSDSGAIRIAGRYPSGPAGRVTEVSAFGADLFVALEAAKGGSRRGQVGAVTSGLLLR
jgi:hypothetical protein